MVVHEDDWLVVVDKPSGVPSVPARSPLDPPSVLDWLRSGVVPGFLEAVHRLDRDTSGLLVIARSPEARRLLGEAFEARAVRKRYVAVVPGRPPGDRGTIHLPLARDGAAPPKQRVDPVIGVRSTTAWRTLGRLPFSDGGEGSLLELEPVTGRSHQLRAHLGWLGMPILGDPLYGRPGGKPGRRMLLHAGSIGLPHPHDGRSVAFVSRPVFRIGEASVDAVLERLLDAWHRDAETGAAHRVHSH